MTSRRVMRGINYCAGISMIEMVAVLVIVGILAAIAVPNLFSRQTFDSRGFFDQTQAAIRYAQKTAIAQHRSVYVNLTANTICLTYVEDTACAEAAPVVLNPASGQRFHLSAPSGVSFGTTGSFAFSALGSPSAGQVINVVGDGMSRPITVESETGYVH